MGNEKIASEVSCRHTDTLSQGSDVIPTVEESLAHDKTSNTAGIRSGKRPLGVAHPKEETEDVA